MMALSVTYLVSQFFQMKMELFDQIIFINVT